MGSSEFFWKQFEGKKQAQKDYPIGHKQIEQQRKKISKELIYLDISYDEFILVINE